MCVVISDQDFAALQERIKAAYPRECPRCQDDSNFTPSFVDDSFECVCGWIWSVEP